MHLPSKLQAILSATFRDFLMSMAGLHFSLLSFGVALGLNGGLRIVTLGLGVLDAVIFVHLYRKALKGLSAADAARAHHAPQAIESTPISRPRFLHFRARRRTAPTHRLPK